MINKPCPFCGAGADSIDRERGLNRFILKCACGLVFSKRVNSWGEMFAAWNTRPRIETPATAQPVPTPAPAPAMPAAEPATT